MGRIKPQDKNNIKYLFEKGMSQRSIAMTLKKPKSTVSDQLKKMNLKRKDPGGRPKILSERDEIFCAKQMTMGKSSSLVQLSKELKKRFDISAGRNTISRSLKNRGVLSGEKKKNHFFLKKISKRGFSLQNLTKIGQKMIGIG